MTENLIAIASVPALLAGLAALIRYARRDAFAGPRSRRLPHGELGTVAYGRRLA